MRALILLVALALTLAGCANRPVGQTPAALTQSPAPSASMAGSLPAPAPSRQSSVPPSQVPVVDGFAEVLVDRLIIRSAPGLDGARLGSINANWRVFIVAGPVDADGLPWYLLTDVPPVVYGCESPISTDPFSCPGWIGWAAAASPQGDTWLRPLDLDCPGPGDLAAHTTVPYLERVACYGGASLTYTGWLAQTGGDAGCENPPPDLAWLYCWLGTGYMLLDTPGDSWSSAALALAAPPSSGIQIPSPGQWVSVVGHYDDPAAGGCGIVSEPVAAVDEELAGQGQILQCRSKFVLESIVVVSPG